MLGVIYGVLLWADMHTATPLRAWGRSVISFELATVGDKFSLSTDAASLGMAPMLRAEQCGGDCNSDMLGPTDNYIHTTQGRGPDHAGVAGNCSSVYYNEAVPITTVQLYGFTAQTFSPK